MIEYKNVVLRYTDKDILKDVNLRIENGEFMVLVGPCLLYTSDPFRWSFSSRS